MTASKPQRAESASHPPLFGRHGPGAPGFGKKERARDAVGAIRRLWSYLRRQKAALIAASGTVAITSGLNLLGPFLLGRAIDRYILPHDLPGLVRICALMAVICLLTSLLAWLQGFVMAGASQRTIRDLRNDLFARLQCLPLRYFDQHAHGDLMSRLTNDVENINMTLSDGATQIVSGLLSAVGIAIAMFWINPVLAAISLTITVSLSLGLNRRVAKTTGEGFRRQQSTLGKLNALIEETIEGQRVVKAYRREPTVRAEFDAVNDELRNAATQAQMFAGFVGPIMNLVNNSGVALVAGIGGAMAVHGLATVGTIATFINYTRMFGRPLNEIANLYNSIQGAIAGAERLFEVMDETPEIDVEGERSLEHVTGDVVFDDVSFAYNADTPVLRGVSLRAEHGQVVALIGPTGAGKTTVVNLLTRFYEVDSGAILIDGADIRTLRKADLRRKLGIVLQDTYLFAGTVCDNIRYGRLDASDEEVVAAARLANADSFIRHLPHGYDTPLTERGGNLSQGQRQLLAIARAVLADPGILILDEATSSVDTRTEQHIQEAMKRLMVGRTSFVIAHRLNTIRDADQILVIDRGEIVERGTHGELLARKGFYYDLYTGRAAAEIRSPQTAEPAD